MNKHGGNRCELSSSDRIDEVSVTRQQFVDGTLELGLKFGMAYSTVDAMPSKTNTRDVS